MNDINRQTTKILGADGLVSNLFILERQQRPSKPKDKKTDIQVKDYMSDKLAMYLERQSANMVPKKTQKKHSPRQASEFNAGKLQGKSNNLGQKQAIIV